MADLWNSVLNDLPNNNDIVWVRVLNIYGAPVLAQYKSSTMRFTTIDTSVVMDAIEVARWKIQ